MPDWTARVTKDRAADLRDGEAVIAATYFQGRGSATGQIMFGAVTGMVGGALANRIAHSGRGAHLERSRSGFHRPEGSVAAEVPDDKGILAITDQRLIVFGYKQGMFSTRILDPVVDIPLERLAGWSYTPKKIASVLNLAFDDGSDTGIELPMANKPDRFAEELAIPRTDA